MFGVLRKYDIICHMKDLMFYYQKAIKKGFALGAFNFSNLEIIKAIASTADELKSPVILAVSENVFLDMGCDFIVNIINTAKHEYSAPLFLHLDHGRSFEICKKAIDSGFDSVMIDGSSLPFEENIKLTKKVCDYAHKKGVFVEGELGQIKGIEDGLSNEENHFTDPLKAKVFVEKTKVDSLAVAIGTSHGAYKYKGKSELRFDILTEIEKALPSFPLVLHGASSVNQEMVESINKFGGNIVGAKGVDEKLLQKAITQHNIVKINMDTDLRIAFTEALRKTFATSPDIFDPKQYLKNARENVKKVVSHKIKNLLNSSNQK